jgi:ferredoxin
MFKHMNPGPLPLKRLKHVDKPTTLITDNVQRIDFRESAIARARRGDYGLAVQREASRYCSKYPLSASLIDCTNHISTLTRNKISASKAPIPEDPELLSLHIKRLGYFLKADIVGICRLPKSAVYSHDLYGNTIDIDYEFAIVFVMRKEYDTVNASTGLDWMGCAISFAVYQHLSLITETIANYIRRLGYPASAQHPPSGAHGGFQVLMPPLLIWAGIGEVSRAGIILNPFLGMNFKAAAVLTQLPLIPDKPIDFGLQDFCQRCNICALACPSKAIPRGDKILYNGLEA